MIVTFEGAPSTGKTTISRQLEKDGAYRIGEVNERSPRPKNDPQDWYLKQQLNRWHEARSKRGFVILDGDIFQPIWYNWIYPDRIPYSWQDSLAFFRKNADQVETPDLYIFWWVNENERVSREYQRSTTKGRSLTQAQQKALKYRNMKTIQQAYFEALGSNFPGYVKIMSAMDTQNISVKSFRQTSKKPTIQELLDFIYGWLNSNSPSSVI